MDLNLLPALQALLRERHVSRAAQSVHLSQSAMSRVLARLREQFDDDLLVRAGGDYQLTPKAIQLQRQLNELLPALQQLGNAQQFEPATASQSIRIASTDMDVLLLADNIRHIQRQAPNLPLSFRQQSLQSLDALLAGELDFVIIPLDDNRAGLHRSLLNTETFVAVVDGDSELNEQNLDLDTYLAHKHGVFNVADNVVARVDSALQRAGCSREVTLRLPTFSQIPPLLKGSPLIFTLPRSFALYLSALHNIKILPLPFDIPAMKVYLYWHHRLHRSPLHQWLRKQLSRSSAKKITSKGR
ncbi:LysR family transcriptional regulator [Bowmanella dokdonensis]|uniref:LysR family transcriptional regulator n=1 Tax=Bowmanella dokdonensis TaxID=751969 RepID=A0A939IRM7_9ALTE|nr:LysR family transcriptional regulator [Bowmanella dokdonensis]MBN7825661.1 LysR family transcriptional regulator [Bowmanella dokdonensis]